MSSARFSPNSAPPTQQSGPQKGFASGRGTTRPQRPPLRRARSNSAEMPAPVLTGVCSGLSVHLGMPVRRVRALMVGSSFFFGAGLLMYLWLWATVPLDDLGASAAQTNKSGKPVRISNPLARVGKDSRPQMVRGQLLIAGAIILVAAVVLGVGTLWWNFSWSGILAGFLAVGGMVLVWTQSRYLGDWRSPRTLSLISTGVAMIVLGAVLLVARNDPTPALLRGGLIGIVVLVGICLALLPLWFGLLGDLSAARTREARETERADIAAHLHDSVLQTLTLIRASADEPQRVRALALTQERELRAWLYTGHEEAADSVAQALRDQVGIVETTYGVEVAVVAVGDVIPGPAELAAVAAAGEATTNAVRHGESPISVYLEVSPQFLEIFVKDAGKGFNIDSIPDDRHGVRDSIMGRISRVGGQASIRTGEAGVVGTEVRIKVPLTEPNGENE